MKELFEFLKDNYQFLIIITVDFVFGIIFFVKRVKNVDSPLTATLEKLSSWIKLAESMFSDGVEKKKFVIDCAIGFYKSLDGKNDVLNIVSDAIEDILSTPTKKKGVTVCVKD